MLFYLEACLKGEAAGEAALFSAYAQTDANYQESWNELKQTAKNAETTEKTIS